MPEYDEVLSLEDSADDMSFLVWIGFGLVGLFLTLLISIDQQIMQVNQTRFQRGLSNALRAYSTTYSTSPEDLKSLSEGYLLDEDIDVYSVESNPVAIDRNLGTEYFFNILEKSTEHRRTALQASGTYIISIVTHYSGSSPSVPTYIVSIYKNGNEAQLIDSRCNSLEEVQSLVENTLDVNIDIAVNYNSSLRQAQEYKRREDMTSNGSSYIYSTYSTTMAIVTNVPIRNMFGSELMDVKEIQTYSIVRGKD